ncbi:MAG: allantoinase AllB [Intestinibacillus sp.]
MLDRVIQNAILVTPDSMARGAVGMQNGKIAEIRRDGHFSETEFRDAVDAQGKLLYAGFIDTHVHLNDPGFTWREDFAHGTRAAAVGGVTTVIDMPLQNEPAVRDTAILRQKERYLQGKAYVDYACWGAMLPDNTGRLREMHEAGAVAFKAFFAPVSPDYTPVTAYDIRQSLGALAAFDGLAGLHCEDYAIIRGEQARAVAESRAGARDFLDARPVSAEHIAVEAVLALAEEAGARVHICHVSHPEVAERIRQAKARGVRVTAETCPHYLVFDEHNVLEGGTVFKCAPPLRRAEDAARLWGYVLDGTLDCVCSDHSPCAPAEKQSGKNGFFDAWGGLSGIQTTAQVFFDALVHQRRQSPTHVARVMAQRPAQIFGLDHRKGSLAVGMDADLTLMDPEQPWEVTAASLQYLHPVSAFIGCKGRGCPVLTLLRGEVVAKDGIPITGEQGRGARVSPEV